MPPATCPNCGAILQRHAKCCPECGADEANGWSDADQAASLGIPDEHFDYNEFVKEEFGHNPKPRGIHWVWWLTALILVLLFLFAFFR